MSSDNEISDPSPRPSKRSKKEDSTSLAQQSNQEDQSKECFLTPTQAAEKNKTLQKGYKFVPITQLAEEKSSLVVEGKRPRKKANRLNEFYYGNTGKQEKDKPEEKITRGKKGKKRARSKAASSSSKKAQNKKAKEKAEKMDQTAFRAALLKKKLELLKARLVAVQEQKQIQLQQLQQLQQQQQLQQLQQQQQQQQQQQFQLQQLQPSSQLSTQQLPQHQQIALQEEQEEEKEEKEPEVLPSSSKKKSAKGKKGKNRSANPKGKKSTKGRKTGAGIAVAPVSIDNGIVESQDSLIVPAAAPTAERRSSRSNRVIKKPKFLVTDESKGVSVRLNASLRRCRDLLKQLMSQEHSYIFNTPVDPVTLNIPDYPTIIKNPMDLGTIEQRLREGYYSRDAESSGVEEFGADVRLVWSNALTYNRDPTNFVRLRALEYQNLFEEKFAKIPKDLPKQKQKSKKNGKSSKMDSEVHAQVTILQQQIQEMKKKMASIKSRSSSKEKKINLNPLTYKEKQALKTDIFKLPSEKLQPLLDIIKKNPNQTPQNDEADELVIDIDELDVSTLRELQQYVKKELSAMKRKNKKPKLSPSPQTVEDTTSPSLISSTPVEIMGHNQLETNNLSLSDRNIQTPQPLSSVPDDSSSSLPVATSNGTEPNGLNKNHKSGSDSDSDSDSDSADEEESDSSDDEGSKKKAVPEQQTQPASVPSQHPVTNDSSLSTPPQFHVQQNQHLSTFPDESSSISNASMSQDLYARSLPITSTASTANTNVSSLSSDVSAYQNNAYPLAFNGNSLINNVASEPSVVSLNGPISTHATTHVSVAPSISNVPKIIQDALPVEEPMKIDTSVWSEFTTSDGVSNGAVNNGSGSLVGNVQVGSGIDNNADDKLWADFKNKEMEKKQKQREREQNEQRLALQREEERMKQEQERQKTIEQQRLQEIENAKLRQAEQKRQEEERKRKLEEEREAARKARQYQTNRIGLGDQNAAMMAFEDHFVNSNGIEDDTPVENEGDEDDEGSIASDSGIVTGDSVVRSGEIDIFAPSTSNSLSSVSSSSSTFSASSLPQ